MTRILEEDDDARASLSRVTLATTSPAYLRAFREMLRTGGSNPLLSDEEIHGSPGRNHPDFAVVQMVVTDDPDRNQTI